MRKNLALEENPTEFYELRKRLRLSQEGMAELFGITRSYYGSIETGKRPPSLTILNFAKSIRANLDHEDRANSQSPEAIDPAVLAALEQAQSAGISDEQLLGAAVAESVKRYGSKIEDNPILADLFERMQKWQEAAAKDPAKAGFMLQIFKKYMPDEDLHL